MRRIPRVVWCCVFPNSELLDLAGPWEVLAHANELLRAPGYVLRLVTPLGGEITTRHGIALGGAVSVAQAARAAGPDTLIVAGGSPVGELPPSEAALARWLRNHQRKVRRIVSICTGAFVLGAAGLLDGRRATTHWRFVDALRARVPAARVVDEAIYLCDGRIWTSAGITAGIDLTLALVEADHGRNLAMAIAKHLLVYLRRSGRQSQFSEMLKRQEGEPPRLRDLSNFVLDHLDEALPVDRLARVLGMSPRTLTRWCTGVLHESPAAFVRRLRLDEARRLLEATVLPLKDIASRTGIGDASTLWRTFMRQLGITPAEYRSRFATELAAPPR